MKLMKKSTYLPALFLASALAWGCSSSDASSTDADAGVTSAVFASTFYGFHDWPVSVVALPAADAGVTDAVHTMMPLQAYMNKIPPHGSTAFPLGTVIVKEVNMGDLTTRTIFAMVKVGDDFNSTGAVNWKWCDLSNTDDPTFPVNINWCGYGPPLGTVDSYGGNVNTCNDCHVLAASNDYVWTEALQLTSF
jgi:hypothetical protein